jgi:hypothetical protein
VATYREIQADIKKRNGIAVKTCWIAHVKELNGLKPRVAPNRRSASRREYPCPPDLRPVIEGAMKRLGIL